MQYVYLAINSVHDASIFSKWLDRHPETGFLELTDLILMKELWTVMPMQWMEI